MNYNFNSRFNQSNANNSNQCNQFNLNHQNQTNTNQRNSNQTNPNKKKRNRGKNRSKNRQKACFFKDDVHGSDYYDFQFNSKDLKLDDLMNLVKERKQIGLDFLDKLVIDKLNTDEESDVIKVIIKKLLDLLHAYQLSVLSEDEKSIIKSRGHLKFEQ